MRLSIVVALYNTEKYIERCIRSIYEGSVMGLDSYEVIVVNDGSNDSSKSIVESLIEKYPNLILIDKLNGGQSSARNIGFSIAKGDYIFCLDSDDYIDANVLNFVLNKAIESDVDVVAFNCVTVDIFDEKIETANNFNYKCESFENRKVKEFYKKHTILGAMCFYLYKRELILRYKLRLHEGIKHEDEEFVTKIFSLSRNMSFFSLPLYYYRIHKESSMHIEDKSRRMELIYDLLAVIIELKEHIKILDSKDSKAFVYNKVNQLIVSVYLKVRSLDLSINEMKEFSEYCKNRSINDLKGIQYLSLKKALLLICLKSRVFRKIFLK